MADWWPDRIADPRLDNRTADRWFDTGAFVLPRNADGAYRFGNAGRGILNGDGLFNIDGGLMKNFRLTERFGMQFRWETFNATNTPTLDDPNARSATRISASRARHVSARRGRCSSPCACLSETAGVGKHTCPHTNSRNFGSATRNPV